MPKIIPVFINYAGCPHQCAFCNQHAINNQQEFSLVAVQEQIDKYLAYFTETSEKELAFYGGSFTGLPVEWQEKLLTIADNLKKQGIVSKIRLSTRPDYINTQIVNRLQHYGVSLVELGVQSLDDKVLLVAKRGHDSKVVINAVETLKNANMAFGIQLMAGLPSQDWESIIKTTQGILALRPSVVRIYPLVIFSGTDFAAAYEKGELEIAAFEDVVGQVAYMAEKFSQNNIKIIRIGLQEDYGLHKAGAIIGGFHHPAFGELVFSHRYREKIEAFLPEHKNGKMDVYIPKREFSQALGHRRANAVYFAQKYTELKLKFISCNEDFLRVQSSEIE